MNSERDLITLIYQADWRQLSLSATVHFQRDHGAMLFRSMRCKPGESIQPDDEEDQEDEHDDADDLGAERRLLIGAGGRYRVSAADGRVLTVCDGTSTWEINQEAASASPAAGTPDLAFHGLMTPRWLLASYQLETTGTQQVQGRTAIAIRATPRNRPGLAEPRPLGLPAMLLDRVDVLIDADLGFLHSSQQIRSDRVVEAAALENLVVDPTGAADPDSFALPPGVTIHDDQDTGRPPPGLGRLGGAAMTVADHAMAFAIRHAPRRRPAWPTDDEPDIPAERWPATGTEQHQPLDTGLVNLLHRTGKPVLNVSAELHRWTSQTAGFGRIGMPQDQLPGFDAVRRAASERAAEPGVDHWVARLRAQWPARYRLDLISGTWTWRYRAIAVDGEHTTKLFADHVSTGPVKPLRRDLARMLDPAWLLDTWTLTPAGRADVSGRAGLQLLAVQDTGPGSSRGSGERDRVEVVLDTEHCMLLRYATYLKDQPVSCVELRDVEILDDSSPGEFTIEAEPGMRSDAGQGDVLGDLNLPRYVRVAGTAAKLAITGTTAAGEAVSGWLDRLRGRPDRE